MSAASGFAEVAKRLRADGFTVVERPNWDDRGLGTLTPLGAVNHHTASKHSATTRALLHLLDVGRSDLRGPLCNWSGDRDGALYLHAAGYANHAGRGGWNGVTGNSRTIGYEAHHDGRSAVPGAQLLASVALNRHCADVFGYPLSRICEHKEWAPGRKVDRYGVTGMAFRYAVGAYTPPVSLEDAMTLPLKKGDKGEDVRYWQRIMHELRPGILAEYGADGDYGDVTQQALVTILGGDGDEIHSNAARLLHQRWIAQIAKAAAENAMAGVTGAGEGVAIPPEELRIVHVKK